MKINRRIASTGLAAMAAVLMSIPAFAATEESTPDSSVSQPQGIIQSESLPERAGEFSADNDVLTEPETAQVEEPAPQEVPTQKSQSDLPLFVGAGISVLVFGGVVAFCRMKGNR